MHSIGRDKQTRYMIALLGILIIMCGCAYRFIGGYSAYDVKGHWTICAYTLHGIDPFPLVGKEALLESVGAIPERFATVPWNCVFGSVFYGGWFPQTVAISYIWILHLVIAIITAGVIYKSLGSKSDKKKTMALLLVVFSNFSFAYSLHYGNAGGIICCLLMIAFFTAKEHPVLAGVFIGFAMMKPQIAVPICIVFLLNRNIASLAVGAAIDVAGWGATALLTHTSFLKLLTEALSGGMKNETQYLGLFSFLRFFGVGTGVIMIINMLIGIAYSVLLWNHIRKKIDIYEGYLLSFVPACIASVFWIYKNGTDFAILMFPALMLVLLAVSCELEFVDYILLWMLAGFFQMSRLLVNMGMMFLASDTIWAHLLKSFEGMLLLIAGIMACNLWVKYYKQYQSELAA